MGATGVGVGSSVRVGVGSRGGVGASVGVDIGSGMDVGVAGLTGPGPAQAVNETRTMGRIRDGRFFMGGLL